LAIILAGLLVSRSALISTFIISASVILFGAIRQTDFELRMDGLIIAINFILLNGVISMFISQFGITLRKTLVATLEREDKLENEIHIRMQMEATLQQS